MTYPLTLSIIAWYAGLSYFAPFTVQSWICLSAFLPAHFFLMKANRALDVHCNCNMTAWGLCRDQSIGSYVHVHISKLNAKVMVFWKIIRFRWGDDLQSSWWDSCPFKKRKRWEFDSPVSCEDTEKEQSFPSQGGLSAGLDNAGLLSQTSNLENCEKMNFYCLSHPIYGILSRQPEQLETRTPT